MTVAQRNGSLIILHAFIPEACAAFGAQGYCGVSDPVHYSYQLGVRGVSKWWIHERLY